jgi:hypothetical protein
MGGARLDAAHLGARAPRQIPRCLKISTGRTHSPHALVVGVKSPAQSHSATVTRAVGAVRMVGDAEREKHPSGVRSGSRRRWSPGDLASDGRVGWTYSPSDPPQRSGTRLPNSSWFESSQRESGLWRAMSLPSGASRGRLLAESAHRPGRASPCSRPHRAPSSDAAGRCQAATNRMEGDCHGGEVRS